MIEQGSGGGSKFRPPAKSNKPWTSEDKSQLQGAIKRKIEGNNKSSIAKPLPRPGSPKVKEMINDTTDKSIKRGSTKWWV